MGRALLVKGGNAPAVGEQPSHLAGAALLMGLALVLLAMTVAVLARAAHAPDRVGRFVVLFPPGWSEERMLLASVAADVLPVATSLVPGTMDVNAALPGAAARLKERGAWLVVPSLPVDVLGMGGCGFAPITDFPDRPRTSPQA